MDNGSMTGCHSTPAIWHQRNTIRFLNTSGERWVNNKNMWECFASSQLVSQPSKQESLRRFLRRWSNIGPHLDSVYLADYEDYFILYTLTDWQIVYRVLLYHLPYTQWLATRIKLRPRQAKPVEEMPYVKWQFLSCILYTRKMTMPYVHWQIVSCILYTREMTMPYVHWQIVSCILFMREMTMSYVHWQIVSCILYTREMTMPYVHWQIVSCILYTREMTMLYVHWQFVSCILYTREMTMPYVHWQIVSCILYTREMTMPYVHWQMVSCILYTREMTMPYVHWQIASCILYTREIPRRLPGQHQTGNEGLELVSQKTISS